MPYRFDPQGARELCWLLRLFIPALVMIAIGGTVGHFYGYEAMMASFPIMGLLAFAYGIGWAIFHKLFKKV